MAVEKRERTFNAGRQKPKPKRPVRSDSAKVVLTHYADTPTEDGFLWRAITPYALYIDHIVLYIDHCDDGCTIAVGNGRESKMFEGLKQGLNALNYKRKTKGQEKLVVRIMEGKGRGFWMATGVGVEGIESADV